MRKFGPISSGLAVGNDDAATATGESTVVVSGFLYGVYIQYLDTPPATAEVTIQSKAVDTPAYNLLSTIVGNTSGLFYPENTQTNLVGSHVLTPLDNIITVKIDKADAGDSVKVWLFLVG